MIFSQCYYKISFLFCFSLFWIVFLSNYFDAHMSIFNPFFVALNLHCEISMHWGAFLNGILESRYCKYVFVDPKSNFSLFPLISPSLHKILLPSKGSNEWRNIPVHIELRRSSMCQVPRKGWMNSLRVWLLVEGKLMRIELSNRERTFLRLLWPPRLVMIIIVRLFSLTNY